ncbi:colicin E3/pyocin S6 family cytotoxin [Pseudomonas sp. FSL R10-0765]|nr:toxin [Pseudomonas sp. FSL R10-0765]MQT52968.1 toxin [Pseudomonas sp. FSL R10-2398]MQU02482.1 toxin [Pseudomonas sp. FSL R10-2245]MQU13866.1 toxin [Pseudomonas sp. FSL R10-2189]MQU39871.1 toxin [Pseudomonas sp. FSL R10-2172]
MSSKQGVTQTLRRVGGDGGQGASYFDDMTPAELKERDAGIKAYEAIQARQNAYMARRQAEAAAQQSHQKPERRGCVFAKCSKLPDAVINYSDPAGFVPVVSLSDYGNFAILGGTQTDSSGLVPLALISGAVPAGIGGLALSGTATGTTATGGVAAVGGTMIASTLLGVLAFLWPSSLADSALYTEDQLRSLKQARTRMRLQVEQQADGSLKGYGFYTGSTPEWEMIDVIQFTPRGSQQVADFGDGVELIWTPATNPQDTLGIPPLKGAPHTPQIWIYPPTKAADALIVNPIYPPNYKDFILVFPADSGVAPLYVVLNVPRKGVKEYGHDYHAPPKTNEILAFPGLIRAKKKTPVQGGGGYRSRWIDKKGRFIYEWDSLHGELELYRASDGSHLGSYHPMTGDQIDPPKNGRNIKKYL